MVSSTDQANVGSNKKKKGCKLRVVSYLNDELSEKLKDYKKEFGFANNGGAVRSIVHRFLNNSASVQST